MSTDLNYLTAFEEDFDSVYVVCEDSVNSNTIKMLLKEKLGIEDQTNLEGFLSKQSTYSQTFLTQNSKPVAVGLSKLSTKKSRNMPHLRTDLLNSAVSNLKETCKNEQKALLVCLLEENQVVPFVTTFTQFFPKFTRKTDQSPKKTISIAFLNNNCEFHDKDLIGKAQIIEKNVSFAAELVDTPCSDLHVNEYIERIKVVIKELEKFTKDNDLGKIGLEVIQDKELLDESLVGIYTVGMAAVNKPALVILKYDPKNPTSQESVALVGKGICYDTGGLSIKGGLNMISMKGDMGGSAAVLGAFDSLVRLKTQTPMYALMCLAENAVDQLSVRPDDIITMHSGKSVEINNTDAEGRLVLGDGVSYASRILKADTIIDIATLTGAQIICTGSFSGALVCNDPEFEKLIVECGKSSGDMVYPILYCPELIMKDIKSEVADMKNSAKGKTTAMSSLAAHFIEAHISAEFKGKWAHIDIAGPSFRKERGTGFGVGILVEIIQRLSI